MIPVRTIVFSVFLLPAGAFAQYAPANAEWNRPIEPFRIIGNLYYVGASDVSAFLFTTADGHILLDTGFLETVPLLENSIRKLGFRVEDIRLLLSSHAHYDHAGGLAAIKAMTKARLLVNPSENDAFLKGGKGDFAFGDKVAFPPVTPDGELRDGQTISLGGTVLTAHFTPGHTRGCTSYTTKVREGGRNYDVVLPCSMTAPGYQLVHNSSYPNIVEDFETSFVRLGTLACDVFLGGHSWDFGLEEKLRLLQSRADRNPFVDPDGYRRWMEKSRTAFRKQLAAEKDKSDRNGK